MNISVENGGDYSPIAVHRLIAPDSASGRRLDQVLAELLPEHSRARLQAWVKEGRVTVDGSIEPEGKRRLKGGETLLLAPGVDSRAAAGTPEDIPLAVVFEDDALLVIDKPAGLVVHPGSGNWSGTLMNALLHRCPELAEVPRAGIVHRLDKETSGLLVVARSLAAQTDLVRQLQARSVKRQYLAVAAGGLERDGQVEAPIGRHPVQRTRMAVVSEGRGGKPALTRYRILERFARCTLVECSLETGRTHQIRVHMASIGHPLVGDPVYGRGNPKIPAFHRQALHAARLGLVHPGSGARLEWQSPLPGDFNALLETLRGS
ncbi:MAG: 23S rRNA pseudouridine(1911/1915/1917) synthase RluD [Dechloromonas sp.]|jgi:23S rRNA pseudouridine1911/1915/1917 synthase|nr:23S rRNA pseudouridine(1911/1915/1917) synthase RluD [Dechloromonas sp.]